MADALDRATGVDVDGGRDLADEENYEGLSVWEREAARELDRMTKVVVEDGDEKRPTASAGTTRTSAPKPSGLALTLDGLTGIRPSRSRA